MHFAYHRNGEKCRGQPMALVICTAYNMVHRVSGGGVCGFTWHNQHVYDARDANMAQWMGEVEHMLFAPHEGIAKGGRRAGLSSRPISICMAVGAISTS